MYRNKPQFSIFGIGEYVFKPYKVAISGVGKSTRFSLIEPIEGKPVVLADTCYFVGFDCSKKALEAWEWLNGRDAQRFLDALVFVGEQRSVTQEHLMRLGMK